MFLTLIKHLPIIRHRMTLGLMIVLLFCIGAILPGRAMACENVILTLFTCSEASFLPAPIETLKSIQPLQSNATWLVIILIAILGTFLIRSERKNRQMRHLKQGAELLPSKLLDLLEINVIFFNAQGNIRYVNTWACKNLQMNQANLINSNITNILSVVHANENILSDFLLQLSQEKKEKIKLPDNAFIQTPSGVRFFASGQFTLLENGDILFSFRNIVDELTQKYIYDMAFSNTKIFPWYFDLQIGKMVIDSRYFVYTGIPTKDNTMTLEEYMDRLHPNDRQPMAEAFQKQLSGDLYSEPLSFRLRRGDNTYEWFEGSSVYLGEVDGSPFRVVGVCLSTQNHKNIEEALIQARDKAEQSDRLKSAFLANISHEIRTPLNAIVGFSELLTTIEDKDEKAEYSQIITTNTELLLRLIDDILNLSKLEAGFIDRKLERFDLSAYFNELYISTQQRLTNPEVQLICENPYPHCIVYLDKERLSQVILNYLTNAVKYTPKGFIRMGYRYENGGIRLYVSDTGIGIAEEKKHKVYQRFEKLDEFAQGTGLGLSICKALTEAAQGHADFESEEGKGSTFWSWLPCEVSFPENCQKSNNPQAEMKNIY